MESAKCMKENVEAPPGLEPGNKGFADLPASTQNQNFTPNFTPAGPSVAPQSPGYLSALDTPEKWLSARLSGMAHANWHPRDEQAMRAMHVSIAALREALAEVLGHSFGGIFCQVCPDHEDMIRKALKDTEKFV